MAQCDSEKIIKKRTSYKSYLNYYNSERGHSSLGYSTPNEVFELSTFEYKKIA